MKKCKLVQNIMNFKFCYIIFCTIICFIVLSVPTFAKENSDNVIRVGSFEETYNVVNEKGERSGYGYEYLQDIAGYAGWTYKYITSDWKNCFTQLENGEIDILGGISYTDERAENMLFSDMPMGEEKYYIYTDASNMDLTAGNLDSFEGKNIGVSKDNIVEDVLNEWESKYGLHTKHINVSTTTEIMDKLSKHEIDCFVSVEESRWEESDISPLTSIGETEIYFAINPERPDIKEALDSAMRRIKDDNPFYTDDLYRRYLSAQSSSFLSKEEREWIGQHGAIRIGYLNQDGGISSVDPSTGKLTGVITDYVDLAENCLQGQTLEFELNGYDTRSELLQALQDGKIDLIFHANQNPYFAETNGFALSDTLLTLNMAAITAKDSFDENKENIVAVEKDDFALKAYLSYNYPQWKVVEYETSDAAVKAMQKGETDCIVSNSGTVSDYLKNNKLHSVFLTKEADVSFAVQQGEPVLLSILNKTLTSMPTTQFSGAVVSYNVSSRKVTAKDFIQDNLLTVSLIAGISFFVVLCIILDSLKKSKRAEEKSKKSAEQALKLNQELEEKQQELQNALVEAQSANKAKTSFLNNMSHDIRTPINGIMGMLTILEKSGNDGERAKDCLNKINESSKLLLSLVNDVLDMAKLESDTVVFSDESINLDQVCQEITESLSFQAEEKGLHVIGEHDDYSGIYVWSNAVHLKKILMNLFTNSMKYNKVNGSIYMSMRTIERSEDHMTCEFKIKDNGIGMSEEFIKNELFTPFVQADNSARSNYSGTGLGMPIVKQLVEKMGGTITVESKLGEGSCFTVILPFKIDTNARPEEKEDFDALIQSFITYDISKDLWEPRDIHCDNTDRIYNLKEIVDMWEQIDYGMSFHGVTYNAQFYKSLGYKLIEGVFYEDQEYATIPLSYAKRIRLLDDELYVYRLGDVNQSVSTQSQLSRLPHFEAVLFKILEHEKNLDKLPEGGRELWTRKISMYLGSLYHILFIKNPDKKSQRKYAKELTMRIKQKSPYIYSQIKNKYRGFVLLNKFHMDEKTYETKFAGFLDFMRRVFKIHRLYG